MNKEMIKTLINDGWEWVTRNQDGTIRIFRGSKPVFVEERGVFENEENLCLQIPSCLFPNITFENSPVELKTLLDDEDKNSIEYKQQQEIRRLIDGNFDYIIREWNNKTIAVYKGDGGTTKTENLCGLCPDKYKKVYLRDLLKKRKVKKSAWLAVDKNKKIFLFAEKPGRDECEFWTEGYEYDEVNGLDFLNGLNVSWEDEPIELTYEVEE